MKAARRPRNPLATQPLLRKGGAHGERGKRAPRAKQKAALRRRLREETSN